jgi:RHS repeat-associated protein
MATTAGLTDKHAFTTYQRDDETGSDYAMNRQYGTSLGRYSRPDPIAGSLGDPQSLNRYAYVSNDPANLADPLGLHPPRPRVFPWYFPWVAPAGSTILSIPVNVDIEGIARGGYYYVSLSLDNSPFSGFDEGDIDIVGGAIVRAKELFAKEDCQKALADIDKDIVEKLGTFLNNAAAKPKGASYVQDKNYSIFDGRSSPYEASYRSSRSADYLRTVGGHSPVGSGIVFLYGSFFANDGGGKGGAEGARAVALLHEAIHAIGFTHEKFGGTPKDGGPLTDLLLKYCLGDPRIRHESDMRIKAS